MAKSSRSSSRKANNQRLAAKVFGPAENARAERLSARLLEVAKQAKPETSDANMDVDAGAETTKINEVNQVNDNVMDLDSSSKPIKANIGRKRIDKRKQKKAGIVFQKYSDRLRKRQKTAAPTQAKASE